MCEHRVMRPADNKNSTGIPCKKFADNLFDLLQRCRQQKIKFKGVIAVVEIAAEGLDGH